VQLPSNVVDVFKGLGKLLHTAEWYGTCRTQVWVSENRRARNALFQGGGQAKAVCGREQEFELCGDCNIMTRCGVGGRGVVVEARARQL
jgi:hypothetical protein